MIFDLFNCSMDGSYAASVKCETADKVFHFLPWKSPKVIIVVIAHVDK